MVHLVTTLAQANPLLTFQIIQVDQFPARAEAHHIQATPTLLVPGYPGRAGNLPPSHALFYLWQAANRPV